MRAWIELIAPEAAEGRLAQIYARLASAGGQVDNILMSHSLRPHTLVGHMALYKAVLHHARNRLPRELLESLGVYVSALNGCDYCVEHHAHGLIRLIGEEEGRRRWDTLAALAPERAFEGRDLAAMRYAEALTVRPAAMERAHVEALWDVGFDDGEVLEIDQVVAYFAYANRTVQGLGISTEGDLLGLSPSATDDPDDWGHR
jgi:uncharacterized peroxidase-related enzyme